MNPYPGPKSVLVMDNCRIHDHYDEKFLDTIRNAGVRIEFLPPYSPDLNPIESAFSKFKKAIERIGEKEEDTDVREIIRMACSTITREDCKGFVENSGYGPVVYSDIG